MGNSVQFGSISVSAIGADDTERISKHLVQLSRYQGSTDNISVIVVFLKEPHKIAAEAHRWATRNGPPLTTDNMEAGLDNANNPFTNSNGSLKNLDVDTDNIHLQKSSEGLLLNLTDNFKPNGTDLKQDIFEKSNGTKNSSSEIHFDDGFGPETDVDTVDDAFSPVEKSKTFAECLSKAFNDEGLPKSFNDEVKAFSEGLANNNPLGDDFNPFLSKEIEDRSKEDLKEDFEEHGGDNREETPTPPVDTVQDVGGLEENPGESDSEDEWNYFKGDQAKPETLSSQPETVVETSELEDAMSQLNPNAAEFVPVSPTRSIPSPACRALINDEVLAQSPKRPVAVDIKVPNEREFEKEVKSRPSDFDTYSNGHGSDSEHNLSGTEQMENILNGKSIDEIPEFQPGSTPAKPPSADEFHFGPNAAPFTPRSLDQSEAFSTNANYGDDTEQTLNTSFNDSELAIPHRDLGDPMSISFSAERGESNPFQDDEDLNKVHELPENLDEFLGKIDPAENKENRLLDDTISDLPEHDVLGHLNNDRATIQTTDLDKLSQEDEKELASPLEPEHDLPDVEENIVSKTPDLVEALVAVTEKLTTDDSNISSLPELEPIPAVDTEELGVSPLLEPHQELNDSSLSPVPGQLDQQRQEGQSISPVPDQLSDLPESKSPLPEKTELIQSRSPLPEEIESTQSISPLPEDTELIQSKSPLREETELIQSKSPLPEESELIQSKFLLPEETGLIQSKSPLPEETELLHSTSPLPGKNESIQSKSPLLEETELIQSKSPLWEETELIQSKCSLPEESELNQLKSPLLEETEFIQSKSPLPEESELIQSTSPLLEETDLIQSKSPLPEETILIQSTSPLLEEIQSIHSKSPPLEETELLQSKSPLPEETELVMSKSPLPEDTELIRSKSPLPGESELVQSKSPFLEETELILSKSPLPEEIDLTQSSSPLLEETELIQSNSPLPEETKLVQSTSPLPEEIQSIHSKSPLSEKTELIQSKSPLPEDTELIQSKALLLEETELIHSKSPPPEETKLIQSKPLLPEETELIQSKSPLPEETELIQSKSPLPEETELIQSKSPLPEETELIQSKSPLPEETELNQSKSPLPENAGILSKSPVPTEQEQELVQQPELNESRLSPLPGQPDLHQQEVHPVSPSPDPFHDLSESKSPIPEQAELLYSISPVPDEQGPENIQQELTDSRLSPLPGQLDLRQQEVQSVSPTPEEADLLKSKSPIPTQPESENKENYLLDVDDRQINVSYGLGGLESQGAVCEFTSGIKSPFDDFIESKSPVTELKPTSDMLETEFNRKSEVENIELEAKSPGLPEDARLSPALACEYSVDPAVCGLQQHNVDAIRESHSPFDPQHDQKQEEEITSSIKDDISSPIELLSPVKSPEPLVEESFTKDYVEQAESEPVIVEDSFVQQEDHKTEVPPQEIMQDLLGDLVCPMPSSLQQVVNEPLVQANEIHMFEASGPLEPSRFTELSSGFNNFVSGFNEQISIKTDSIKPEFAEPAVITPSEDSKVIDEIPAASLSPVPVQETEVKSAGLPEAPQEASKELPVLAPLPIVPVALPETKEVKKEEKKSSTTTPSKKPIGKVAPSKSSTATSKTSTAPKAPVTKASPKPAASSPKTGVAPRVPSKTGPLKHATPAAKTTSTTAATKPSPKPKTAPAPKPIERKPLTNGDVKPAPRTTLTKRPSTEATATKTTTRPATTAAAKTSPTKTTAPRPATAPRTAPPKTGMTLSKPPTSVTMAAKPRVPLASRPTTTSATSKLITSTTTTKTTTTAANRTSLSPKMSTAPPKPKTITYTAPKPRAPLTKTITKSADVEKEKKESANKLTASRTTTVTKTTSATATSRTATTTVKKTESKPLSNRTALSKTSATTMRTTTVSKKPGEIKSVTKTKTTRVEKPKENGIAPTNITEEIKEITIVNNIVNETENLLKDNSPLDNKLITETTNALIDVNPAD